MHRFGIISRDASQTRTQQLPLGSAAAMPIRHRSRRTAPRGWRRVRTLLLVTAIALILVSLAVTVFLARLPAVGDAEVRVDRSLRTNGGIDSGLPAPAKVGQAVVAVEDERFYAHHGIDTKGVLRAIWATHATGITQGGATISQQLAKALYVTDTHTVHSKLRMMGVAVKLEMRYSKPQILEMYLNAIYFGDGQWGITNASHAYFNKAPGALDWAEASLLAGLPQAPSSYDPTQHFTLARERQRHVLDRLVHTGTLSQADAASASAELTSLTK